MSYIAYINGNLLNLGNSTVIPYTKQVNDLARLDNRQSNFTHKFIVSFVAQNIKSMEFVYMVGNQSNIPYKKNTFDLIDADSGEHLIYNGWAVVTMVNDKGYEINVTDGIIDFYRKIENKSLTDIGISELNHAKSLITIKNSWANEDKFIYAISDYNGKNEYVKPNGERILINTDYQIPSARVSYLWQKIHDFAGFTFSGEYFKTDDFKNLFLTFPKPVTQLGFDRLLVYTGQYFPVSINNIPLRTLPRENFDNLYSEVNDFGFIQNGQYRNNNIIIRQAGRYNITLLNIITSIENPEFTFFRFNVNGILVQRELVPDVQSGQVGQINGVFFDFNCDVGDQVGFIIPANASGTWNLYFLSGVIANFENAFIDLSAIDFVKEVITQAGLTQFKNKFNNNIEYLTINEILANTNIIDWSKKFQSKDSEKYKIGNYAKRNNLKRRYNTQNETHNDGFFVVDDNNLNEKIDVFQSKIYSPELLISEIANEPCPTFKIWNKEIKENGIFEYKDLTGRFYFLRTKTVTPLLPLSFGSELLGQDLPITSYQVATYDKLSYQNVIDFNYKKLKSILNKSKMISATFDLNFLDIKNFDFKSLIAIEQLSSYYLVNKITNYIKGKPTKCELIEVDYELINDAAYLFPNTATYIIINSFTINGCELTVNYSTDATTGSLVKLFYDDGLFADEFAFPQSFITTGINNTATVLFQNGGAFSVFAQVQNFIPLITSNFIVVNNISECFIVIEQDPFILEIINITILNLNQTQNNFEILFNTNVPLPRRVFVREYYPIVNPTPSNPFPPLSGWTDYDSGQIVSSTTFIKTIFFQGQIPEKFQIKIGNKESNEFTFI